ncbi:MAG: bifunctional demethylmenaquinone methyltransferase/2-methoxy-6-polyprenyl-1,4-benzoquinol methylase UbiE [Flavobacteriaceae bacterium]
MKKMITPYKDTTASKKEQVTKMFDSVSAQYDRLNRVISLGIDQSWRKKVVRLASEKKPHKILDIATGTGDLAIALTKTEAEKIIGLDISPGMLSIGKKKVESLQLDNTIAMVLGDSEKLDFDTASFDLVTVAFGVRNFENLNKGLQELFRVLKPNGTLLVLETAVPTKFPFKQGYRLYSGWIVPLMGKLLSRDKLAYQYLSDSAAAFPHGKAFNNILEKIGFINVEDNPQTLGVASIYCATKP